MRVSARCLVRLSAAVVCAVVCCGARGQVLDLSAPERPTIETSALVDVVDRLNHEIEALGVRAEALERAGADADLTLSERLKLRARVDAVWLMTPWLDVYSDGWRSGMLGMTIARALGGIDGMAGRYMELALAARGEGAPEVAVVAYQRARGSLRRFVDAPVATDAPDEVSVRATDLRYNGLARAHAAMYPREERFGDGDRLVSDAARSMGGAVLGDAAREACARLLGEIGSDRLGDASRGTRDRIARAVADAVWGPGLAAGEFGAESGAAGSLEAAMVRACGARDVEGLERLARAARVLRLIGVLRRGGLDTRALGSGVEGVLIHGLDDGFLRVAERVLGVCVAQREMPGVRAEGVAREQQKGWRLTLRAYETLEGSVLEELVAVAGEPGRLRDPGTVSLIASHRGLVETMRRALACGEWERALAARGDAASLAAAGVVSGLGVMALEEETRAEAGDRLARLEVILESVEPGDAERALAAAGSSMDRASGGVGRELARQMAGARSARLMAWARGDDGEAARLTGLHERLLRLIGLVATAGDAGEVAAVNGLGAAEFDERGVRAAAERVRAGVEEACIKMVGGEVAIAADAIEHAESRAGLLELIGILRERARGSGGREPVDAGAAAGAFDDWGEGGRRALAQVSRLLLEAGDLRDGDIDARGAVEGILAYAEHLGARLARESRPTSE
ncbi:MAG: hypothetical protein R3B46_08870 [Phycisphaerales bacterium]